MPAKKTILIYSRVGEGVLAKTAAAKLRENPRVRVLFRSIEYADTPERTDSVLATESALEPAQALYEGSVSVKRLKLPGEEPDTDLGEDFPGRTELLDDGRFAFEEDLRDASKEERLSVSGIGPSTLEDIREALGEEGPKAQEGAEGEGSDANGSSAADEGEEGSTPAEGSTEKKKGSDAPPKDDAE